MHPLIRSIRQFLLLFFIWLPVMASIIVVNHLLTDVAWIQASVLMVPPLIIEMFILISTYYICKAIPLGVRNLANIILKHAGSLIIINVVWIHLTMMYSEILVLVYKDEIWRLSFNRALPLLIVVGLLFYFLASLFHYLVITLERNKEAQKALLENQLMTSRAELDALKAKIQPHFLFNSLTAIGTLSEESPRKAAEMSQQLAEFLRYSLKFGENHFVPLKDELDSIRNYLNVEKTRLGHRLQFNFEIDDRALQEPVLPFTLLPLIENSVKHGVQQLLTGGDIRLKIKQSDEHLLIEVSNPLNPERREGSGTGQGLANLQRRLDVAYKTKTPIYIHSHDKIHLVRMLLPRQTNAAPA